MYGFPGACLASLRPGTSRFLRCFAPLTSSPLLPSLLPTSSTKLKPGSAPSRTRLLLWLNAGPPSAHLSWRLVGVGGPRLFGASWLGSPLSPAWPAAQPPDPPRTSVSGLHSASAAPFTGKTRVQSCDVLRVLSTARQVWLVTWSPPPFGDLFFPPFSHFLWFPCLCVRSFVCRYVGFYCCGFEGRACHGFSCLSSRLCSRCRLRFVASSLAFWGSFPVSWTPVFHWCSPRVDSFNTCSRRRLQVYDSSSWNAALFAFHDQPDLPHFLLYWRSP